MLNRNEKEKPELIVYKEIIQHDRVRRAEIGRVITKSQGVNDIKATSKVSGFRVDNFVKKNH